MIEKLAGIYRIDCGLALPGNLETISIPGLPDKKMPAAMLLSRPKRASR